MNLARSVIYLRTFQFDWHFMLSKDVFKTPAKLLEYINFFSWWLIIFCHLSNKGKAHETFQLGGSSKFRRLVIGFFCQGKIRTLNFRIGCSGPSQGMKIRK